MKEIKQSYPTEGQIHRIAQLKGTSGIPLGTKEH